MAKNITGLGRGLGALIDTEHIITSGSSSISEVDLDLIFANPNQPRTHFDEDALTELASSIRELGVISPITLRKNDDGTYLIIAGERRFRASKTIGLKAIPAYVKTAADEQVMEMALIENIQREDLNAIEIALRAVGDFHGDGHSIANDFGGVQVAAHAAHVQRELEHFRNALGGFHRVQHQLVRPKRGADL